MRLLTLHINEPLPGQVLPLMAEEHGDDEAARRYRAITVTTMRQLRGLAETRLRILSTPEDAAEAIRFWLLPRLADRWHAADGVYRTEGWEIDFGDAAGSFQITAQAEILCPLLSARWAHAAMLGLERGTHHVTGPVSGGGSYFNAQATIAAGTDERILPELPIIQTHEHWLAALASPIGPALKRAWEEEG